MNIPIVARTAPSALSSAQAENPRLRDLAEKLEAAFLAEMLSSAGLGSPRETFGGEEGETQFSSFLVQEQAHAVAAAGGIGLAEAIYHSLVQTEMAK